MPPATSSPVATSVMLLGSGAFIGVVKGCPYELHGSGFGFGLGREYLEYAGPTATNVSRTATTTFFMRLLIPREGWSNYIAIARLRGWIERVGKLFNRDELIPLGLFAFFNKLRGSLQSFSCFFGHLDKQAHSLQTV